ncbi:MAG: hypothetical protein NHF90_00670, partial [Candidatus Shikimatogenerans sp. JK-2022]|nr:hypothetical protein [Candidatus Shikimatogenerans bostrichidophilus]
YYIYRLYIIFIINKYPYNFSLYKKYLSNKFINICNKFKILFIYEYQNLTFNKWRLLKLLLKNFIYIGNKIYLWVDFKNTIYKGEYIDYIKLINFKNYKGNIILEKYIKKNYLNNFFIILFNNNLFYFINKKYIKYKKYKKLYNTSSIQLSQNKYNGYVNINIIKFKNDIYLKIIKLIKKLFNQGYSNNDIIILLRNKIEVNHYIKKLNNENKILKNIVFKNYIYLNDSIYINILILFLKCLYYKRIYKYRINLILLLNKINIYKIPIKIIKGKINLFLNNLKKYKIYINYKLLLKFNIYEKIVYIIKKLKLKNNLLYNFIDIIYKFELKNNNNNNIYRFIKFWSENKKNFIISNINYNNIIKILSINNNKNIKGKIIILPLLSWNIFYNYKHNFKDILFYKMLSKNYIKNIMIKKQIDNFNILYNLTTRAINKLILFIYKNNNKYNIYHLFQNFLKFLNIWKKKKTNYYFGKNINNNNKSNIKKSPKVQNNLSLPIKKFKYYKLQNKNENRKILIKYIKKLKNIKIINEEYYYNKKIIKFNNLININNCLYIIKVIEYKKYKINNIINNMYKDMLLLKNIYKNKYKIYKSIFLIVKNNKILYKYKI